MGSGWRSSQLAQAAERVDAARVAVAPRDLDARSGRRLDAQRVHVVGHRRRVEAPRAAPLVDALRAAAGEPQLAHVVRALDAVGPRDRERARAGLCDLRRRGRGRRRRVASSPEARVATRRLLGSPAHDDTQAGRRSRSSVARAIRASASRCASRAPGRPVVIGSRKAERAGRSGRRGALGGAGRRRRGPRERGGDARAPTS